MNNTNYKMDNGQIAAARRRDVQEQRLDADTAIATAADPAPVKRQFPIDESGCFSKTSGSEGLAEYSRSGRQSGLEIKKG